MNKNKTLTIIDWDDTLFPTTWLLDKNIELTNPRDINKYMVVFYKLDTKIHHLLCKIIKHSNIHIVTNASIKWINITLTVLPNTKKFLKRNCYILSARDSYQKMYPNDVKKWKTIAFEKLVNTYYKNIVSIGDADYELNATINLYSMESLKNNKLLKTIKLVRHPSLDVLIDQLNMLKKNTKDIIKNSTHMDLNFKKIKN